MRQITKTPYYSKRIGNLPNGCQHCVRGEKLVLFVTGICNKSCWYCPLSEAKKNKDVVFANEWKIDSDKDIITEAKLCESKGAGITGGDPFRRLDRTLKYIRLLKKKFGKGFHIHLYTPGTLATHAKLKKLHEAGLDEIRFHPEIFKGRAQEWDKIKLALEFKWNVGCEIPLIPGYMREIKKFIDYISSLKNKKPRNRVKFINLNELEMSETSMAALLRRGFRAKDKLSYGVKGSSQLGSQILEYCRDKRLHVHYCSSKLKDKVQLARRIKKRAGNVAKVYDITTDEGMLIRGAIYLPKLVPGFGYRKKLKKYKNSKKVDEKLKTIKLNLIKNFKVHTDTVEIDKRKLRVLTGVWVVENYANELKKLNFIPAVVEEYPTWDQTEMNVEFL